MTPLHLPARSSSPGTNGIACLLLASNGATVDSPDFEYHTPLHYAAELNNLPVAETLISNGADPNRKFAQLRLGFSPLHMIIQSHIIGDDPYPLLHILYTNGAHLDEPCSRGLTPIGLLAETLCKEFVVCRHWSQKYTRSLRIIDILARPSNPPTRPSQYIPHLQRPIRWKPGLGTGRPNSLHQGGSNWSPDQAQDSEHGKAPGPGAKSHEPGVVCGGLEREG